MNHDNNITYFEMLNFLGDTFNEEEIAWIKLFVPPDGIDYGHNLLTAFGSTTRYSCLADMFAYLHNVCSMLEAVEKLGKEKMTKNVME